MQKVRGVEIGLECNIYSVDVNSLLPMPVLIRKYNIPNSYVKRELFEVIYSFEIDYFSCRYFQTIIFNVWLILSMPQSGTKFNKLWNLFLECLEKPFVIRGYMDGMKPYINCNYEARNFLIVIHSWKN